MASERIFWTSPGGVTVEFTDQVNYWVLPERTGFWNLTYQLAEVTTPMQAGTRVMASIQDPRAIDILLLVKDTTFTALRSRLRLLVSYLNTADADGTLTVMDEGGSSRSVSCRYKGGMEVVEERTNWAKFAISLYAASPFWMDASATSNSYTSGTPALFFPFFPLKVSSSTIFADITVSNSGDVETFPIWTIRGPGSGLVITNNTTGKLLSLTYSIGVGETVIIDTRAGAKTVLLNDGTNLYSLLSAASSLFPLQVGSNSIRVELNGTDTNTLVTLEYYRRYIAP